MHRKRPTIVTLLAFVLCAGTPWASVNSSCTGSQTTSKHALHTPAEYAIQKAVHEKSHTVHGPIDHSAQVMGHAVDDGDVSVPALSGHGNHADDAGSCGCCEQASCALTHCGSLPTVALQFHFPGFLYVAGALTPEHFSSYTPVRPPPLYRPPIFR